MSHHRAKEIRKELRKRGKAICAEPYMVSVRGEILASPGRAGYQKLKKEVSPCGK